MCPPSGSADLELQLLWDPYMLTVWFQDPRTCGEGLGTRLKCGDQKDYVIQDGTFPRPSPTFSFTSWQLQELRTLRELRVILQFAWYRWLDQ